MTADRYLALGWNPIPLRKDKRPWIAWAPYQERRVTPEELEEWRRRHPGANVGIVTGAISGIVVLDVDGPAGAEELKKRHLPPHPDRNHRQGNPLLLSASRRGGPDDDPSSARARPQRRRGLRDGAPVRTPIWRRVVVR